MEIVDSHCHLDCLDLSAWQNGIEGVLDDAMQNAVNHFLCVSINLEDYGSMLDLVSDYARVAVSVGLHPNERDGVEPTVEQLVNLANNQKVVAIGETGLDYFRCEQGSSGELDWQRDRFRVHIEAAKQLDYPLIIHNRDAKQDTIDILRTTGADSVGGVMHCFVEDWQTAKQAMDLNFYISFSGIVTFKSAKELKEVAKKMPLDRILVETDSPYLAPVPYRGKANQPAYTRHVLEHIAELRGMSAEALAEHTSENFFRLFPRFQPVS
ncbi:MAG: TatD family hydrolase [Thiohalomonadales bacterium]